MTGAPATLLGSEATLKPGPQSAPQAAELCAHAYTYGTQPLIIFPFLTKPNCLALKKKTGWLNGSIGECLPSIVALSSNLTTTKNKT
jgi:hypothetical protein